MNEMNKNRAIKDAFVNFRLPEGGSLSVRPSQVLAIHDCGGDYKGRCSCLSIKDVGIRIVVGTTDSVRKAIGIDNFPKGPLE